MASLPSTFSTLKSTLLANARQYGVCEGYYEVLRTNDYQELIDAGIPQIVYAYKCGILTDALLAEVDQALLNANGIYTTNATISNPVNEIFVLGSAEVTVNIDNGERHNINVMGTAKANVTITGNSFAKMRAYQNAQIDVTLYTTAAVCIETYQNSNTIVIQNDSSVSDISAFGDSILSVTSYNNSHALIQCFAHTVVQTAGDGIINLKLYDLSRIPIFI